MSLISLGDSDSQIQRALGQAPNESYGQKDSRRLTNLTLYACILNKCTLINCKLYKCVLAGCNLKNCTLVACRSASDDIQTLASGKTRANWILGGQQLTIGY